MLGRFIEIDTGWQTVAAIQDLIEVKLGTGQAGWVVGWKVMQSSIETITNIAKYQVELIKATGSYTASNGTDISALTSPLGATAGSAAIQTSQAAHGFAANFPKRNGATVAVIGTGTIMAVDADAFNEPSGVLDVSYAPEEWRPFGPSEAAILRLAEAPASSTIRALLRILMTHG